MKYLTIIIALSLTSCGVVYKGKFGRYTLTPTGTVVIEPNYAK